LSNIIKIDLCNFELYRFKVGAFLRHSVYHVDHSASSFVTSFYALYAQIG